MIDPEIRKAAARELLARRKAQGSLIESIRYVAGEWFQVKWYHELIAEILERIEQPAVSEDFTFTMNNGKLPTEDGYKEQQVTVKLPLSIKRSMINTPPRHGKSEVVSIRRPAYCIGRDSLRMFMNIAYGSDLAVTFSKACTRVMQNSLYRNLFPVEFDQLAKERWKVKRPEALDNGRDSMIAAGILSPLTGEGATDANIDDPFKNKSEAYSKTIRDKVADEYATAIRTRLHKGASVTLTMTRWHNDDLAGRLLEAAKKDKRADQWLVLVLAATNDTGEDSYVYDTRTGEKQYLPPYEALWPEKFPRTDLDSTKASMAGPFWEAMYMQRPTTALGTIFRRDKWKEFMPPVLLERAVHVWDTALEDNENNDYSAHLCVGISAGRFIVRNAYHERLTFPDLVKMVYKRWKEDLQAGVPLERLLIEQKGSGISLIQTIEANNIDPNCPEPFIPVLGMPATVAKEIRALSVSGYQEAGGVYLPMPMLNPHTGELEPPTYETVDGQKVEWLDDFIEELAAFPKGVHDDWVDAFVHALTFYTRPIQGIETEETVVYGDDVTLSSELDRVDSMLY